jgi:hypothetical protein
VARLLLLVLFTGNVLAATSSSISPATTNNDDSCDIGLAPAATLLLPYFQVELTGSSSTARTTVFSVINVSPGPQIARVTIWTDWSYPALTFSLFLTGYDVKAVDLRELLVSPGHRLPNYANPYHKQVTLEFCDTRTPQIPDPLLADVRGFLTTGQALAGSLNCSSTTGDVVSVGSNHGADVAAGYVTIDLVSTCSPSLPTSSQFFKELLFDNVLIGDYQAIDPSGTASGWAGGSPLVHLRAVPEGGAAGSIVATRLPYTFYDRFTDIDENTPRTIDRRQPLPSAFAARWIDGGPTGFETTYAIWREAVTGPNATCGDYAANDNIPVAEIVRFDERENAAVFGGSIAMTPKNQRRGFSSSSVTAPYSTQFPVLYTTDLGGWAYLNLSNGGAAASTYSAARAGFGSTAAKANQFPRNVSQNWVVINMFAEDRYGVSFDAQWLGNGCSPALAQTSSAKAGSAAGHLGPAPNINP